MKKFYNFLALVIALCVTGASCTKTNSSFKDGDAVLVKLNVDGEFDITVDQEPLTKAGASNDAYGINVYYDKEGDGVTNNIYAYGLFDNTADMSITMLSNHKYKVCCTLIKDARTKLYFGQAFNNAYSGYCYPFQTTTSGSTLLNNKFIVGSSAYLSGMYRGYAHVASTSSPSTSNATKNASVNRFYGETDQYEPIPNGTIDIYLKRVVFGAKFVISGVREGSLNVKCGDFFNKTFTKDDAGTEQIYSFSEIYTCWKNDTPMSTKVSFTFTSDRGELWNISQTKEINFKRNVMTTVNVQLKPDLSGGLFDLAEEPLDDDNNIHLGINTDGLIDIDVNPEN